MIKQTINLIQKELNELFRTKKVILVLTIYLIIFYIGIKVSRYLEWLSFLYPQTAVPVKAMLVFYSGIIIIPLVSVLASYDVISGEVEDKSIKYLISRMPRHKILLSKLCAPLILIGLTNLLVFWVNLRNNVGFYLFLIMGVYSVYFISLSFLISTILGSSGKSIKLGLTSVLVVLSIPKRFWYFSPRAFIETSLDILKGNAGNIMHMLPIAGYIIIFIVLAIVIFERKDI